MEEKSLLLLDTLRISTIFPASVEAFGKSFTNSLWERLAKRAPFSPKSRKTVVQ